MATELPETVPSRALARTATLAGPPEAHPATALARFMKNRIIPVEVRKDPKRMKRKMKVAETPMGMPMMPSVVNHMWVTIRFTSYPRWVRNPGK